MENFISSPFSKEFQFILFILFISYLKFNLFNNINKIKWKCVNPPQISNSIIE